LNDAEKIESFHNYINNLIAKKKYKDCNIVNMDETPIWFDTPPKRTFDTKGVKDVYIVKNCNDRSRITGVLAVTKAGTFLPTCIISKSSSKRAVNEPQATYQYHNQVHLYQQQHATMTSKIMVDYIQRVLIPHFSQKQESKLLIMDSFSGHLTDEVKSALNAHNFDVAIVPGGCTKYLQPLDLTVNRSFKAKLKKKMAMANGKENQQGSIECKNKNKRASNTSRSSNDKGNKDKNDKGKLTRKNNINGKGTFG
jgi:hypothetical protein